MLIFPQFQNLIRKLDQSPFQNFRKFRRYIYYFWYRQGLQASFTSKSTAGYVIQGQKTVNYILDQVFITLKLIQLELTNDITFNISCGLAVQSLSDNYPEMFLSPSADKRRQRKEA